MSIDLAKDPTQWFPMPAVLVTSREADGTPNVMGIGYVGFCCWQPPTLYLGMNTARHSNKVIREAGEFTVALPPADKVLNLDYCGFVSGTTSDKFTEAKLTPRDGRVVTAPLIEECPVNLECTLRQVVPLGSHDLFLGEVVETHIAPEYLSGEKPLQPIVLLARRYMAPSEFLCNFGDSAGCPPED
jgi:flavin reductase (DIM6/NTAB) family NADH-FMN oxidoreductase RutF